MQNSSWRSGQLVCSASSKQQAAVGATVLAAPRRPDGCRRQAKGGGPVVGPSLPSLAHQERTPPPQQVQSFPADYTETIKQAQEATRRALADGCKLVEVRGARLRGDARPPAAS